MRGSCRPRSKGQAVRQFIGSSLRDEFTIADIRRAAPGVSDDHIRKVPAGLRAGGVIEAVSKGRSARYRRLRADFSAGYRIATPVSGSK